MLPLVRLVSWTIVQSATLVVTRFSSRRPRQLLTGDTQASPTLPASKSAGVRPIYVISIKDLLERLGANSGLTQPVVESYSRRSLFGTLCERTLGWRCA